MYPCRICIVLTMPNVFWPIFQAHRRLQHDLPALGATVLQQWAWTHYRVRHCGIVIQHTFGGHLNYHPHLHIMVSAGGLKSAEARWVESLQFDRTQIMELWRFAVCSYLWKAHRDSLLQPFSLPAEFNDLILRQTQRRWNIHITRRMSKAHFLRYAGRYIRRLPISQRRILTVTKEEIVYQSKHADHDFGKSSLHTGGVRCSDQSAYIGPVPALNALLRPAGTKNKAHHLGCRLHSARPEATSPPAAAELAKLSAPRLSRRSLTRRSRPANVLGSQPPTDIGLDLSSLNDATHLQPRVAA